LGPLRIKVIGDGEVTRCSAETFSHLNLIMMTSKDYATLADSLGEAAKAIPQEKSQDSLPDITIRRQILSLQKKVLKMKETSERKESR
jgi:hypothetical protein